MLLKDFENKIKLAHDWIQKPIGEGRDFYFGLCSALYKGVSPNATKKFKKIFASCLNYYEPKYCGKWLCTPVKENIPLREVMLQEFKDISIKHKFYRYY